MQELTRSTVSPLKRQTSSLRTLNLTVLFWMQLMHRENIIMPNQLHMIDWKRLDLFGKKTYVSVTIQFRLLNYKP